VAVIVARVSAVVAMWVPAGIAHAIRARWRRGETTRQILSYLRVAYPRWSIVALRRCLDVTIVYPPLAGLDTEALTAVVAQLGGAVAADPAGAAALEQVRLAIGQGRAPVRGKVRRDRLARLRTELAWLESCTDAELSGGPH
jgi:hypothetical protein